MSSSTAWKIATLALTVTSLGLAAVLVTRPTPVTVRSSPSRPGIAPQPDAAPAQERRHVAPSPTIAPEGAAQAVEEARVAKQVAALDAMTIEDVCHRHLLPIASHSSYQGPRMERIVARLQQDPERAAKILEDWLRRRDEIRAAALTGAPGGAASMAYVGLVGSEATPLLREIVLEQQDLEHLPALIRTGDPAALKELDDWQRSLVEGMIDPYRVTIGGPHGVELIRGWAFDADVRESLRVQSQACLWGFGTDDDRERLLRVASREQIVISFFHVQAFDESAREGWKARLRELVIAAIDDEDPWVRLLAVQRTLYRHAPWSGSPWPDDVIARAAESGRTLLQLPPPGGRDPQQWKRTRDEVAARIDELEKRPAHERRVREVLGFEEPERTDTE